MRVTDHLRRLAAYHFVGSDGRPRTFYAASAKEAEKMAREWGQKRGLTLLLRSED